MTRDALRAAVQPHLGRDFDAVYDAFAKESGTADPRAFVDSLVARGLLPPMAASTLRAKIAATNSTAPPAGRRHTMAIPPPPEDEWEDDAHTVVASEMPAPPASNRGPATASTDPSEPQTLGIGSGFIEPPTPDDEWEDEDEDTPSRGRTMFRKQSDGGWRETDVQDGAGRRRRRRRRRNNNVPPPVRDEQQYDFIGVVGEGAMGKVHLASDKQLNRKVAFKAMSEEIAAHATLASKFTAEAQITAQLDHPNIVPVYALESQASYTMKLIKGITVEDIIQETRRRLEDGKSLDEVQTLTGRLDLFLRACDALFYAHSRGVVHRDLKPENIMVGEFHELYVMDWGIARLMGGDFHDKVQLVEPVEDEGDLVIGTPGYMSPEQAEGQNERLDGRSDQYSLGLILFELVSLNAAVSGKSPLKIVMRHQDGEKDPLVHCTREKIPSELRAIIHKATAKDRDQRYPTVKALADDIRRYLRGEAVIARPDNPVQALFRWMGKHRQLTATLVVGTIGGLGMITVLAIAGSQIALARAEARDQEVGNLLSTSAAQASLIDGQFLKYEGLLSVIATHAEDSLARPPYGSPIVRMASDFDDRAGVPGTVDSKRYGRPVSLSEGAYILPPGASESRFSRRMHQLDALDRHYYKIMLRSHSEGAATYTPKRAERALSDVGVPIARAYVGLQNGLHSAFPGHGGWPEGYDSRSTEWYQLASKTRGPTWGAPAADLHGLGLVLTCAQSLYDPDENLLGVAGVDVTFDYIIEDLLELPGFDRAPNAEAFLLDAEGRVVVRSKAPATDGDTLTLEPFESEEVLQAVKEKRTGHAEDAGAYELVMYNRMNSIGWYYVVAGPESELLALDD